MLRINARGVSTFFRAGGRDVLSRARVFHIRKNDTERDNKRVILLLQRHNSMKISNIMTEN